MGSAFLKRRRIVVLYQIVCCWCLCKIVYFRWCCTFGIIGLNLFESRVEYGYSVKDCYLHYKKAGDQYIGQTVAGISAISIQFAAYHRPFLILK